MRCPQCGYIHGFEMDDDGNQVQEGASGAFYTLPVRAERGDGWNGRGKVIVYVCPSCMAAFGGMF